jgi:modulator of FtsH protease HflK
MPWNDNRGGGRGPWGQGPQGGGGGGGPGGIKPPDLDEILKQMQSRMKGMIPTGGGQKWIFAGAGAFVLALWLFSGIYIIQPTERGVVLRFGEYVDDLGEGIHLRFPYPIETVDKVLMTRRQINVGTFERNAANRVSEESLMLTGDENIVDIDFQIFWRVVNPRNFLYNVEGIEPTIKAVAESAMREAVGQEKFNTVVTAGRVPIQQRVRTNVQAILDSYGAGVEVTEVNLQNVDPPPTVLDAFRDVQAAAADADRLRNEAEKYENSKVPEARGLAAQIVQQAEAYKSQVEAEAIGEAARFNSIYEQYRNARGVTRERMFLETMEKVLGPMNKVIIDGKSGSGGVQPFLSLPPDLLRRQQPPATQ